MIVLHDDADIIMHGDADPRFCEAFAMDPDGVVAPQTFVLIVETGRWYHRRVWCGQVVGPARTCEVDGRTLYVTRIRLLCEWDGESFGLCRRPQPGSGVGPAPDDLIEAAELPRRAAAWRQEA